MSRTRKWPWRKAKPRRVGRRSHDRDCTRAKRAAKRSLLIIISRYAGRPRRLRPTKRKDRGRHVPLRIKVDPRPAFPPVLACRKRIHIAFSGQQEFQKAYVSTR